ncbi:hypothetical protein AX15_002236 [Amanita polypyramis BW_CC]|nr:hypothetical protein AX15_002236 [Amanita polypyramis BW_CC]
MALPPASASGLTIKVEGPNSISDVADLKLTATITNTSDNTLTLVNDPSGILTSGHPTERYNVSHPPSGAEPLFKGVRFKFSPQNAADLGHVTVLAPSQSVTVEHDLSRIYDFTHPGPGQYTFEPNTMFYAVDPISQNVDLINGEPLSTISIYISGRLVIVAD